MERTPLHKRTVTYDLEDISCALKGLVFLTRSAEDEMVVSRDELCGFHSLISLFSDLIEETSEKQGEQYLNQAIETQSYKRKYEDLLKQTSQKNLR